jgi:hypothetical protein
MRLRATAVPKVRVAMLNPNRAWLSWLARTDKLKKASENFLPRRFTSRNSAGWCKRLRGSNVSLRIGKRPEGIALRAELLAALGTAASQQSTAALGGHARTKAVGTGTMQITGVEGTFHSRTRAKTTGEINGLRRLRRTARVLTEP